MTTSFYDNPAISDEMKRKVIKAEIAKASSGLFMTVLLSLDFVDRLTPAARARIGRALERNADGSRVDPAALAELERKTHHAQEIAFRAMAEVFHSYSGD